ncbi:MAG: DEAD/DEAH box helicase [Chitinivibrionales bacterium]|nr:DEAD/DEAH box helicase [Chitinivibrionales bacterium]
MHHPASASITMNPLNPLIVQSDNTLLLEVNNASFTAARDAIAVFAHLEKSPEHIHSYRITPLSLWNAAAVGISAAEIITRLRTFSKYSIPANIEQNIIEQVGRFGKLTLEKENEMLVLRCSDVSLLANLIRHPLVLPFIAGPLDQKSAAIRPEHRGTLKQALIALGYPAYDRAGYVDGTVFACAVKSACRDGSPFTIRAYQRLAAESFIGSADLPGGSGVVVLPCGAGKTIVGIYCMSLLKRSTLILVTNVVAARQWKREILDKTDISADDIGEYSSETKDIKPVTIATYQILTYRKKKTGPFLHYHLFNAENWGLIIYDEVHLLPAPVFKMTAELQARRRLGLTATLIREDGHETDVFTLIGPKKFDVPWKDLERQGWIATARCVEIRVDLPAEEKMEYLSLMPRMQIRTAYENSRKIPIVNDLLARHAGDRVLIIGQYLTQLDRMAEAIGAALITGSTPNSQREILYDKFRRGAITRLIVSKVGNFAIDLPDANVAIQISGSFGSRQEEAQRLGRILRPKKNGEQAIFYSLVTRETKELDFAMKRQLFLTEQGYEYEIKYYDPVKRIIGDTSSASSSNDE